jgi:hypothetical protein
MLDSHCDQGRAASRLKARHSSKRGPAQPAPTSELQQQANQILGDVPGLRSRAANRSSKVMSIA